MSRVQLQPGPSMAEFGRRYATVEQCEKAVRAWRWQHGFSCPRCGAGIHSLAVLDRVSGVIFGLIQNVTERKRNEMALVESEARFRNLFEGNGSTMLLIDPSDGEIRAANAAAARYHGYPIERLVGMNTSQINTLPAREIAQERARAFHEERTYFNFSHRLASGEVRDTEVYATPCVVAGKPLLLSIVHDITARKRAEQAMLQAETFSHASIDAVSEHLCVLNERDQILAVNQAWRDFYDSNCDRSGPVAHDNGIANNYLTVCDLATGPEAAEARQAADGIRQVIRGEREAFELEFPCHSPTEQRWFLLRVTRLRGNSGHVVVANQDITSFIRICPNCGGRPRQEPARVGPR